MKHLFIVNPVAGGRDSTSAVTEMAKEAMRGREDEYEVYRTRAVMDAVTKIEMDASMYRKIRVYACGGDGTLNECVNGAAGRNNVAVTHFPCGTGNDFVKMFGSGKEGFFDLGALIDGQIRKLDLIECNGRKSVNICSVGIDARIGTDVHKYSRLPLFGGVGGYIVSTLVNVVKGINSYMKISVGGERYDGHKALVCACNGRFYGGSFNPMPIARPDDGYIDFLIVGKITRLKFAKLVGKYAKGRYEEMPDDITYIRGKSMEIDAGEEIVVNIDGEAIYARNVRFHIIPEGINFIFPGDMAFFNNEEATTENIEAI